jgi:hypothetical protein
LQAPEKSERMLKSLLRKCLWGRRDFLLKRGVVDKRGNIVKKERGRQSAVVSWQLSVVGWQSSVGDRHRKAGWEIFGYAFLWCLRDFVAKINLTTARNFSPQNNLTPILQWKKYRRYKILFVLPHSMMKSLSSHKQISITKEDFSTQPFGDFCICFSLLRTRLRKKICARYIFQQARIIPFPFLL